MLFSSQFQMVCDFIVFDNNMQKYSFSLNGWQTSQPPQSSSYRNHLLQLTNNHSKIPPPKKHLQMELPPQKKYEVFDSKSILSVKLLRQRIKTQERSSKYLQTMKFKDFKEISQFRLESQQQEGQNFASKNGKKAIFVQNLVVLASIQKNIDQKSPSLKLQKIRSPNKLGLALKKKSISAQILKKQQKIKLQKGKGEKSSHSLHKQNCSRQQIQVSTKIKNAIYPKKERRVKNVLLKAMRKMDINQDIMSAKKDIFVNKKKLQIKLTNMLQKSNKKRRQLQQLIKSRMLVGKKDIKNRINSSKICHMLISDMNDFSENRSQFDDDNIYKPWRKIKTKSPFYTNRTLE